MRVQLLIDACAVAASVGACVSDLHSRRIPNVLTFGAAAFALVARASVEGWTGAASSIAGWGVGVLLFVPIFAVGGMGAGDLKLLGAVGAWLGPAAALRVDLYSAIAGGVMALIVALVRGYLRTAFCNLRLMTTTWMLSGGSVAEMTLADAPGPRLAYALPIAAGTAVTLWLR